jgi:hypothetical protein
MCCRTALAERPSLCPISAGGIRLLTNSVSSRSSADDQRVCGPRAVRRSSLASRFAILSDEAATSCLRAVLAMLRRRGAPADSLRERLRRASERPELAERLGIMASRCSRVGSHWLQRCSRAEVPRKRDSVPPQPIFRLLRTWCTAETSSACRSRAASALGCARCPTMPFRSSIQ